MSDAYLTDASPVERASAWTHELVRREARGPGDYKLAMERVGRRIGVGYRLLWSLRYRKPKDLPTSAFLKIWSAWEDFQENQMRNLSNDVQAAQETTRRNHHFVASSAALVAAYYGPDDGQMADADHGTVAVAEKEAA